MSRRKVVAAAIVVALFVVPAAGAGALYGVLSDVRPADVRAQPLPHDLCALVTADTAHRLVPATRSRNSPPRRLDGSTGSCTWFTDDERNRGYASGSLWVLVSRYDTTQDETAAEQAARHAFDGPALPGLADHGRLRVRGTGVAGHVARLEVARGDTAVVVEYEAEPVTGDAAAAAARRVAREVLAGLR